MLPSCWHQVDIMLTWCLEENDTLIQNDMMHASHDSCNKNTTKIQPKRQPKGDPKYNTTCYTKTTPKTDGCDSWDSHVSRNTIPYWVTICQPWTGQRLLHRFAVTHNLNRHIMGYVSSMVCRKPSCFISFVSASIAQMSSGQFTMVCYMAPSPLGEGISRIVRVSRSGATLRLFRILQRLILHPKSQSYGHQSYK